jgi:hypothetical protein
MLAVAMMLGAITVVPACGDAGGDESIATAGSTGLAEIRAAFKRFEMAVQESRGEEACSLLTASARKEAELAIGDGTRTSCPKALAAFGRTIGGPQKPSKVVSVEIDGNHASASVSDGGRPAFEMPFVKEDGVWKVARLAPPDQ